ncbi:leucine-rich repeat protein (LRRP) [Trypanosoma grayi]|uniref:leucine-rich repeat protein (LRRP) n=1 Tax=Trypanosoma grayi TaxID=71804 RepID=UPI0004F4416A|nr:leucine-rich repeat protein (LRRP) [Trypanosoma grayi]KEG11170.1 leucine-rich repeat protein (LRRP) [Trypanosoma grayi]
MKAARRQSGRAMRTETGPGAAAGGDASLEAELNALAMRREELVSEIRALHDELSQGREAASRQNDTFGNVLNVESSGLIEDADGPRIAQLVLLGQNCATQRLVLSLPKLEEIVLVNCCGTFDFDWLLKVDQLHRLSIKRHNSVKNLHLVEKLRHLHTLQLDGVKVSDVDIQSISAIPDLGVLSLKGSIALTDVSPLGRCVMLHELNLSGCTNLKNFGNIFSLQHLVKLHLNNAGANVSAEAILQLSMNAFLEDLVIENCPAITDVGPLAENTRLKKLNLSGCNNLTTLGRLAESSMLRELSLRRSAVTDETIQQLGQNRFLKVLHLDNCVFITDFTPLTFIASLEELSLCECTRAKAQGPFPSLPELRTLLLRSTAVNDECIIELGKSPLVEVDLRCCGELSRATVEVLTSLPTLEVFLTDALPEGVSFGEVPSMRSLTIGGGHVTNAIVEDIISKATKLLSVHLMECKLLTDITALSNATTLTEVRLVGCRRLESIHSLGQLPHLRKLVLGGGFVTNELLSSIAASNKLTTLHLVRCPKVGSAGLVRTFRALETLKLVDCGAFTAFGNLVSLAALTELILCCMRFGKEEAKGLMSAKLRVLHIEQCGVICASWFGVPNDMEVRVVDCAGFKSAALPDAKTVFCVERTCRM